VPPDPANSGGSRGPEAQASHRLHGIESLRSIAAGLIVAFHTVEIPALPIPASANVIRTHFGLGVPLFYTLSGFVLSYGYLDAVGSREEVLRFYVRRYFRIAPLFYAMLFVWIGYSALKWAGFAVGPFEFLLNVSLLFGLVPGRHESIVWAGWSIGIEILFYAVFPIFAAVLSSRGAAGAALLVFTVVSSLEYRALAQSSLGSFAYMNLVTHLPFFIAGMLAFTVWRHDGFRRRDGLGRGLLLGVALATSFLVAAPIAYRMLGWFTVVTMDRYVWAVVFAALILSVCYFPSAVVVNRVTRYLGNISFSTYLLHPFVIAVLLDVHKSVHGAYGTGFASLAMRFGLTFGVTVLLASATFAWIEKPGMALGKRLSARVAPRAEMPASG
jgi:peptidoglycan/LPS O-acetylase OafA/YrhL